MANFNINTAGFIIVGIFVATWVVALSIWHFGHVEAKWDAAAFEHALPERRHQMTHLPGSAWSSAD